VFKKHEKIDQSIWKPGNTEVFEFTIDEPGKDYRLLISVRHAGIYPFKDLPVKIKLAGPSGIISERKTDLKLADEKGFIGDPAGDIWDIDILYKKGKIFPTKGKYKVEVSNRSKTPLPGVMEIGVKVKEE
jgi:gliding motility-associated lipoprotein GldH